MAVASEAPGHSLVGDLSVVTSGLRFHPQYDYLISPAWYVPVGLAYAAAAYLSRHGSGKKDGGINGGRVLRLQMQLYNILQILVCGYMTWGLGRGWLQAMRDAPNGTVIEGFFALNATRSSDVEYFVLVHFFTKFLDMLDTFFIVQRGKKAQLSFLHVFHHATIGPVWGLVLGVGHGSGPPLYGALINSFTHVLMYMHYLFVSMGRRNPFKRVLTMFQIAQFYTCVAQAILVLLRVGGVGVTEVPRPLALLQLTYHITMILLFSDFYTHAFAVKPRYENGGNRRHHVVPGYMIGHFGTRALTQSPGDAGGAAQPTPIKGGKRE